MSKEKLLRNIEEGLLNYYLDKDYSVDNKIVSESDELYEGQNAMYKKLPHYHNLFINLNDMKLYMVKDGEMVEVDDGQAIFFKLDL